MSATKNWIDDKICEIAEKHHIDPDRLMDAYIFANTAGIKFDFNNFEHVMIKSYHIMEYLRLSSEG